VLSKTNKQVHHLVNLNT